MATVYTKENISRLVGYISLNYPEINVVPKSMCQDDEEKYFSLVRGREASPTVLRFFEIRKNPVY